MTVIGTQRTAKTFYLEFGPGSTGFTVHDIESHLTYYITTFIILWFHLADSFKVMTVHFITN